MLKEHQKTNKRRNNAILKMRIAGKTLEEIGERFDLTRERVRQIIMGSNGKFGSLKTEQIVKKRDNNECVFCGRVEDIEFHHKDRDRKNNKPSNIVLLCRKCHRNLHRKNQPLDKVKK